MGALPVEINGLWHRYGGSADDWTLQAIDLKLQSGELVGLLGPSGCGKTTLLRLIAGFETPTRGVVRLHGSEVATPERSLPPERRGVGMVFQDYALFPHLNAWDNTCFGLRRGRIPVGPRGFWNSLALSVFSSAIPMNFREASGSGWL